jgi:hypothetical protein
MPSRVLPSAPAVASPDDRPWPDFRGRRVNYKAVACAIAERLDAVPAPWTRARRTGDAPLPRLRPADRTPTPHAGDRRTRRDAGPGPVAGVPASPAAMAEAVG